MPSREVVPGLQFRILGPLVAELDGRPLPLPGNLQRGLLALLLIRAGKPVSNDLLIAELWGEHAPEGARKRLQVAVTRLRKALEFSAARTSVIRTEPAGYRLTLERCRLDANRFDELVAAGRSHLSGQRPTAAVAALREALDLWHGDPFADVPDLPSVQLEIVRLSELRLCATEDCLEAELKLGRHREVIPELQCLTVEHPLRERLLGQLMLALYRAGRHAHALDAYRDGHDRLTEALGLEPGSELKRLQQAILTHDPALWPEGARR